MDRKQILKMLNNNVNIHCWSWREEGWFWSILPAVTDMAKGNRMVTCWANGVGTWVWLFLYYRDSTRRILILSKLARFSQHERTLRFCVGLMRNATRRAPFSGIIAIQAGVHEHHLSCRSGKKIAANI